MTYEELNLVYKFLYNEIGYYKFEQIMKSFMPHTSTGYIDEKWELFQRNLAGFLATYDKRFFNEVMKQIKETNYSG